MQYGFSFTRCKVICRSSRANEILSFSVSFQFLHLQLLTIISVFFTTFLLGHIFQSLVFSFHNFLFPLPQSPLQNIYLLIHRLSVNVLHTYHKSSMKSNSLLLLGYSQSKERQTNKQTCFLCTHDTKCNRGHRRAMQMQQRGRVGNTVNAPPISPWPPVLPYAVTASSSTLHSALAWGGGGDLTQTPAACSWQAGSPDDLL